MDLVAFRGFEASVFEAEGSDVSRSNSPPSESESAITLRALVFFFAADSEASMGAAFSLPEASSLATLAWLSAVDPESRGRFALAAGLGPPPKNDLFKKMLQHSTIIREVSRLVIAGWVSDLMSAGFLHASDI